MLGLSRVARAVLGSANDRLLKQYKPKVEAINALEAELQKLSDADVRARFDRLRTEVQDGATLDDMLVPTFALVREAARRALNMRHFDVQLIGGMVLNDGRIAEMKTGEGKTLVATLAVCLNALAGRGVHIITVNDYLAQRDAAWMGQVYSFLGLSTGVIVHGKSDEERRAAYACDVTYGTNNEFGFDYLRDNMKHELADMVQRDHSFAIVDEVDSILIDEARTPLIISGAVDDHSDLYQVVDGMIPNLTAGTDYETDEKQRTASLTDSGMEKLEAMMREAGALKESTLYDIENVTLVHHANQALRAHALFQRDRDYIVKDAGVVIIDEFTGRMMPGRRFSDGLHQALEAKEKVAIQPENQTLASITFQNYFRMYEKLAGMTGTALTEADEFFDIYKLQVVEVPTNMPVGRVDEHDEVYRTAAEKNRAIIEAIKECRAKGQPVLVGTTSIEKSEMLAEALRNENIDGLQVLNARYHEQEAHIIAQAGKPGAITIATNMAGRGTDIQLGGNPEMRIADELANITDAEEHARGKQAIIDEVEKLKQQAIAAGGLCVMGTERHESRRIDNQLRGRSGRQGDPGLSRFYLSLEDDLMRIFGSERMDTMLQRLGLEEGEAIIHPWINKALERAQQKVEARNFDARKHILKFDDVMNDQRKVIFEQRRELMAADNLAETVADMRAEVVEAMVAQRIPEKAYAEEWDIEGLDKEIKLLFRLDVPVAAWAAEEGIADEEMKQRILRTVNEAAAAKTARFSPEIMRQVEKAVLLQTLDGLWRDHLAQLDHLRSVIGFRGYGQRDPLSEFKSEAFELFQALLSNLRRTVVLRLSHVELGTAPPEQEPDLPTSAMHFNRGEDADGAEGQETKQAAASFDRNDPDTWGKVGRNEPCPCGSGKKFKRCHGTLVE